MHLCSADQVRRLCSALTLAASSGGPMRYIAVVPVRIIEPRMDAYVTP